MTSVEADSTSAVLIDTDVCSFAVLSAAKDERHERWATVLRGRLLAIAVQTRVELLAWPLRRGWGVARRAQMNKSVEQLQTIDVTPVVQDTYVHLTVWAANNGHPIHQKIHASDRWIAATALAHGLELATGDRIFDDIQDLRLLNPY